MMRRIKMASLSGARHSMKHTDPNEILLMHLIFFSGAIGLKMMVPAKGLNIQV
jgi:hypothetical protein